MSPGLPLFFSLNASRALPYCRLQVCFHAARGAKVVRPSVLAGSRGHVNKWLLRTITQSRLPQKQGLCQVAKTPDFEMLSDFYQAFAWRWAWGLTILSP